MEKYEQISVVGEGSYGLVMKCRHRDTDQLVAIKKFLETEEDATVRRMALREIRMLKRLRHENLVTMIEVFRHRKRFYLVFEFLEGTVLDELEKYPEGLGDERTRERIFQVSRAIQYCHSNHIIHRDVKPENVLVSAKGIVKLCDFGFARLVGGSGETYTEYVATRWYRAPELLVGEPNYGAPVDIWAIGCLFSEMMTGEPLFPGESDIDQLYLIVKLLGKPCTRHQQLMAKSPHLRAIKRTSGMEVNSICKSFPTWSFLALEFLNSCMKMDPMQRYTADELLKHNYFTHDRYPERILPTLREKVRAEFSDNPLLRKYKVDILMASEARREELKPRRITHVQTQIEPPRWKINFVQGSVKRKFSSDTVNSENNDSRSFINLNKNIQKIPPQKLGQLSKNHSLQSLKKDEKISTNSSDNIMGTKYTNPSFAVSKVSQESSRYQQKENSRYDKAMDLLSKLNQKSQFHRPKSTNKDVHQYSHILAPSPPEFQSLQSQSFRESFKSPPHHTVLHPNITNINFVKDMKKSPHTNTSTNNISIKSVYGQASNNNHLKVSYQKRNENRLGPMDSAILFTDTPLKFSPPDWFNKKKDPWKHKSEEFSLPLVPGATGSPSKPRKKQTPEYMENKIHTPRILSSSSHKSSSKIKHLPFM